MSSIGSTVGTRSTTLASALCCLSAASSSASPETPALLRSSLSCALSRSRRPACCSCSLMCSFKVRLVSDFDAFEPPRTQRPRASAGLSRRHPRTAASSRHRAAMAPPWRRIPARPVGASGGGASPAFSGAGLSRPVKEPRCPIPQGPLQRSTGPEPRSRLAASLDTARRPAHKYNFKMAHGGAGFVPPPFAGSQPASSREVARVARRVARAGQSSPTASAAARPAPVNPAGTARETSVREHARL